MKYEIHIESEGLNEEAAQLQNTISNNFRIITI